MFGQQRLLIITFIILAFCQLYYVHGNGTGPVLIPKLNELVHIQWLRNNHIEPKEAEAILAILTSGGRTPKEIIDDLNAGVLLNDDGTKNINTTAPGGSATTQYAFVPMMLLPVLPIYYML